MLCGVYREVVAVEHRQKNIDQLLDAGHANLTIHQGDVRSWDHPDVFDLIYNAGILYHLDRPWDWLRQLRPLAPVMFLDTHLPPDGGDARLASGLVSEGGYWGYWYPEKGGIDDPLGGLELRSFWPIRDELLRMLLAADWQARLLDDTEVCNGWPRACFLCT